MFIILGKELCQFFGKLIFQLRQFVDISAVYRSKLPFFFRGVSVVAAPLRSLRENTPGN